MIWRALLPRPPAIVEAFPETELSGWPATTFPASDSASPTSKMRPEVTLSESTSAVARSAVPSTSASPGVYSP
ncbi:hypothetical protein BRC81_14490 [Halobacteriales archaeon QS_1_68_20]|nr:MAG: hypothetical protein BRC81_14490 [Halobacteriales archaeon QS_1_68_20]